MSLHETPLIRRYYEEIGGTLIEEYLAVPLKPEHGKRLIDAVIIPDGEKRIITDKEEKKSFSVEGKDIICVQCKADRLGMYLMGQTLFSEQLLRRHNPRSIISVAICTKDDVILRPMLEQYANMRVVIYES